MILSVQMKNVTKSSKLEKLQLMRLKDYMAQAGYDGQGRILIWSKDRKLVREYRITVEGKLVTRETCMNNWKGQPGFDSEKDSPYYWKPCREALLTELKFEGSKLIWPEDSTLWKPEISDKDFRKMKVPSRLPIEVKRLKHRRK